MAWHQVSSETELLPLNDDDDSYDDGHNKRAPVLWGHYQSIIRLEPPPVRTAPFDDQSKVMWTGRNWLLQDYRNQNTPADARCTIGVIDEAQCLQKILQTSVQGLSHCEHDFAIRVFVPTKENKEIVPFTIVMAPPVLMPATCIELRHLKREDQRGKADPTTKGVTSEGLARIDAALAMGLVMRISVMATCRLTLITVPVKSTLQRYQQFLEHLAAMATNHRIAAANLRRSAVYCHLYRGEPQVAANERQHLMSNLPYLSVKQRSVGGVRKDLLFWTAADRLHDVRHVWCRIDDRDNIDVDDARDLTQLLLEGTSQTVENLHVALLRQVRVSLSCDGWSRRAAGSMSWVLSPTGVEGAPVQNGSLQRSTSNSIGYEVRMGYENGAVGCVLEWTSATKDTIRLIEGLNGPLSNLTTDAGSPPRRAPHLAVVYVTGSQQLQVNIDLTLKRQPPFLEEESCPLSRTVCLPPKYRYPDDDDALVVTATYENGVIVIRISGFLMRYDL